MELKSVNREVEHDIDFDEAGNVVLKKKVKVKQGRKSRSKGGSFEVAVRKDLEEKGWIVDKWSNNVDLSSGEIVPCRRKFNPFNRVMSVGTGFPDFVCFQKMKEGLYKVIGVEVKMSGMLSKVEKEKCAWYLERKIFSEIWVASKNGKGVEYADVRRILERMRRGGTKNF